MTALSSLWRNWSASEMFRKVIPSFNILSISVIYWRLITVPSDDDGILSVCDKISSFGFYDDDDDDVKRYQKVNNAVMTI